MERAVGAAADAAWAEAERGGAHVTREVRAFLTHTSIKGVGRAIRTANLQLKALWVGGVVLLLCESDLFASRVC